MIWMVAAPRQGLLVVTGAQLDCCVLCREGGWPGKPLFLSPPSLAPLRGPQ